MAYFCHHLSDNYVDLSDHYVDLSDQGRSQELEMGGAKLLGEGSGGRLRPPVGPGGQGGAKPW